MSALKILKQKENPLLKRKEVEIMIESNVPPKTSEAEEMLSKEFSTSAENVKIKKIAGNFGSRSFVITANIYHSKEGRESTENQTKKEKAKASEAAK